MQGRRCQSDSFRFAWPLGPRRLAFNAIAQVYIGLGNKDRAFEWLNKAVMQRDGNLFLKVDPIYDSLRNDVRFGRLLHSINLN